MTPNSAIPDLSSLSGNSLVLGIGIDLVDIRRIKAAYLRFPRRFRERLFTMEEQDFCEGRPDPFAAYARHFAVKEACAKALGTGLRRGVYMKNIRLERLKGKKPEVQLDGGAALRLEALTPKGRQARILSSLTDEPPFAAAMVVITAETA